MVIVFFLAFFDPKEEEAQKSFSMDGFRNPLIFRVLADSRAFTNLSF